MIVPLNFVIIYVEIIKNLDNYANIMFSIYKVDGNDYE